MGITCKSIGKLGSIMRKLDNVKEKEYKENKKKEFKNKEKKGK